MKNRHNKIIFSLIAVLLILSSINTIYFSSTHIKTIDNKVNTNTNNTLTDPWAIRTNGSVYSSFNGSDPWTFTGNLPKGYNFVSTAADDNNTYVLTNDGQIWRHNNFTWKTSTWSKLLVPLPIKSDGWVSIDVSNKYIYVLNANGDVYRIAKDPGWPTPGLWVQSSNAIPIALPFPLTAPVSSFVSIAVDWNDSFCFVLRNNGEVYRHCADGCSIWGFTGSWTGATSTWDIYAGFNSGAPPYKLEHDDGVSTSYWNIPSTGWISLDVFDNYYEPNYTVYVLHTSGLVARHTNLRGWATDDWINPNIPWVLDPRWPSDWRPPGVWKKSTAFVSIACNDKYIFILMNTGTVFWILESQFQSMIPPYNSWAWTSGGVSSPLPPLNESKTSAYVSIDAWNEPFILKNDGKEWRNLHYTLATAKWEKCWDNTQNNGKGTLYPKVFSYSSITAFNPTTLFVLSLNGTIYKSKNKGATWTKFGNLGYGNDSAWVSIASANYKNHSYIYALYNNGTVVRTPENLFSRINWGDCDTINPDTSWVSITLDENATIYTLRNLGLVSYKYQTHLAWHSKGQTIGNKVHQDSSWVSIEAYHLSGWVIALRNDEIYDGAPGGPLPFINLNSIPGFDSAFVALCQEPQTILTLTNVGDVYDGTLKHVGTIKGGIGFIDITYFIDNYPWNAPAPDFVVPNTGTFYVNWKIYDDVGVGNYWIYENGTLKTTGNIPLNGSTVSYTINNSRLGKVNYTIIYSDSMNQKSIDMVMVTVTMFPWSNHPADIYTNNATGTETINWTLYDDRGYSHYRVIVNNVPGSWKTWSSNGTTINFPINRS
ncbi:MAG: hypothetical protein ACTSWR_10970, partial [Candidatus Helarchaeota archaeon]